MTYSLDKEEKEAEPFEKPVCLFYGLDMELGIGANGCALRFDSKDKRCVLRDDYQPSHQEEVIGSESEGFGCYVNTKENRIKLYGYLEKRGKEIQIEYLERCDKVERLSLELLKEQLQLGAASRLKLTLLSISRRMPKS